MIKFLDYIIEVFKENSLYMQSAFLLIILMFYTKKIKSIAQAVSIWFIAVIFSSMTIPAMIEIYAPHLSENVEVISLIIVCFDIILVPIIIRLFAKEMLANMLENKIVEKFTNVLGTEKKVNHKNDE